MAFLALLAAFFTLLSPHKKSYITNDPLGDLPTFHEVIKVGKKSEINRTAIQTENSEI